MEKIEDLKKRKIKRYKKKYFNTTKSFYPIAFLFEIDWKFNISITIINIVKRYEDFYFPLHTPIQYMRTDK